MLLDGLRRKCRVKLYCASFKDLPPDGIRLHVLPWVPRPAPVRYLSFLLASTVQALFGSMRRGNCVVNSTSGDCLFSDVVTAHFCVAEWLRLIKKDAGMGPVNNVVDALRWLSYLSFWEVACLVERVQYRMPHLRAVIAVSDGLKREIIEHYGVDQSIIHVVRNAVDPAACLSGEETDKARARVRRKHALGDGDIVALFVGGNWKRKGVGVILEALRAPTLKSLKLLVVGPGDIRHYSRLADQAGLSGRVIFAGPSDRIGEYYAAGDLFVFPSAYESCGLVILEAAANGLPVVATPVPAARDLLVDGYNGYLADRSPEDIAEKIRLVVEDPVRMRQMGENARNSSRQSCPDSLAEGTLRVFKDVYRQKYG